MLLEVDLEYIKKRTSTTDLTLKKFDSNAAKIQQLKGKRAKPIRVLKALNEILQVLEIYKKNSKF